MTTGTIILGPRIRHGINKYDVPPITPEESIAVIGWHVDQIQRSYAAAITSSEQMDGGFIRLYNHTRRMLIILAHLNGHRINGESLEAKKKVQAAPLKPVVGASVSGTVQNDVDFLPSYPSSPSPKP